jgi:hypothetical protein
VPFTVFEFKSEVANFQIIFTIAKPIQLNGSGAEIELSKLMKSENSFNQNGHPLSVKNGNYVSSSNLKISPVRFLVNRLIWLIHRNRKVDMSLYKKFKELLK